MKCYVYALFRPDGTPCYIGKGSGGRVKEHARSARTGKKGRLPAIIRKAGGDIPYVIIHKDLDDATAYAYEEALIRAVGIERDGGPLVNHGYGGNGCPKGVIRDEAFRAAAAERMKGNNRKKGKPNSELWRQRTSARMRGNTHTLGMKASDETRAKLSVARKGVPHSPEHRENLKIANQLRAERERAARPPKLSKRTKSEAAKERWADPEFREKALAARKTAGLSDEGRQAISESVAASNRRRAGKPLSAEAMARRSEMTKRGWETRRARQTQEATT